MNPSASLPPGVELLVDATPEYAAVLTPQALAFAAKLARGYKASQMSAYVQLQEQEFAAEKDGYSATKHQREVGAGYFDDVTQTVTAGKSSVTAMTGSTEEAQFHKARA